MEKRESDDESNTCDQTQTNLQESRRLSIQHFADFLHANRCRDANCQRSSCQKWKKVIQHANNCKRRNTDCATCKFVLALYSYHIKNCQEAECPVPRCIEARTVMENNRLQKALIPERRVATMPSMSGAGLQTSAGNSNSSSQPSPGAQPHSSLHPTQIDIGMEPTTGPPVDASQAMPNPGPSLGGMQRPTHAWQQLLKTLKSPPSAQQEEQVFAILKSNPQLIVALFRARVAQQNRARQRRRRGLQPTTEPPGFVLVWSFGGVQRPAKEWQQILQALKSLALYKNSVSSNKC